MVSGTDLHCSNVCFMCIQGLLRHKPDSGVRVVGRQQLLDRQIKKPSSFIVNTSSFPTLMINSEREREREYCRWAHRRSTYGAVICY